MIVIVDGMDRCGKDTLIKNLRKQYFSDYKTLSLHCSSPPTNDIEWSYNHYNSLLSEMRNMSDNGWNVIFNRSHLGEAVWGPIYRNNDASYVFDLELKHLDMRNTYLIMLLDTPQACMNRDDGQSLYSTITGAASVYNKFLDVFNQTNINKKLCYNISESGGFCNLLDTVEGFLSANYNRR